MARTKSNIMEASAPKVSNNSAAMKAVMACLAAGKTMIQSIQLFEKEVENARMKCLAHAEQHGDVMPMDRLVKGLTELNHPSTTRLAQEVVASLRAISPIRWNAKGEPRQLKEGDEGYTPYDVIKAEEVPFYETAIAKRARQAADAAAARVLKPVTEQDVLNRIKGVIKFVENAQNEDKNGDIRGIADKQKRKITGLVKDLQAFILEHGGTKGDALVEEPATKKAA